MFWQIASTVVAAAATFALAMFAGFQLWREHHHDEENRLTAEARISYTTYAIRRQLRSWLGIEPKRDHGLEAWLRDAQNAGMLGQHLDRAEHRFKEVLDLTAHASPDISAKLRDAYVHFLAGTNRLNEYGATPRPSDGKIFDWVQLRSDAEEDLADCVNLLESGPIHIDLVETEKALAARRLEGALIDRLASESEVASDDEWEATPNKDS